MSIRKTVVRAGLEALYLSGAHRLARYIFAGSGAILMMHRVRPPSNDPFQPHRSLEISPEFLEETIVAIRDAGIDIVALDEIPRRLAANDPSRFVALTFDDGYRDNLEFAWPILRRQEAPWALFLPSAFADGRGELWWLVLEEAIGRNATIRVALHGTERLFASDDTQAKEVTYRAIYAYLRSQKTWEMAMAPIRELADRYNVDMARQSRETCMGWDEIGGLAAHPLTTIGAHTVAHPILTKLTDERVRTEMQESVGRIEEKLGLRPVHFSYPVGTVDAAGPREFAIAAELGFASAVTARPGMLYRDYLSHMTALPRISVSGDFQRRRYLDVLLSGAPTALLNRFRRVDVD